MNIFDLYEWDIETIDEVLSQYRIKWRDMEDKACIKPHKRLMYLSPGHNDLAVSIMHELGHHIEHEEGIPHRYAHSEIEEMAVDYVSRHPEVKEYLDDYVTRL